MSAQTKQQEIWDRYVASWNAKDAAEKRRLFDGCLAKTCVYTDPLVRAQGEAELLAYMLEFQKQVPGGQFRTDKFITHHGKSIAHWKMLDAKGNVIGDGASYGEYDEQNRLVAMTGFFDTPPSEH